MSMIFSPTNGRQPQQRQFVLSPSNRKQLFNRRFSFLSHPINASTIVVMSCLAFVSLLFVGTLIMSSVNHYNNNRADAAIDPVKNHIDANIPSTGTTTDIWLENMNRSIVTSHDNVDQNINHYTNGKKLRKRKSLPSFDNGGVILFFHIAKTGGVSIRHYFQQQSESSNIRVHKMYNPETAIELEHLISYQLSHPYIPSNTNNNNNNSTILMIEIHGDVPGFLYWQRKIQNYREIATKYSTSLFTFTLLREPLSFHLSYFNQYQLEPCDNNVGNVHNDIGESWCSNTLYNKDNVSEQSILDTLIPNHQCLWLSRISHNPYKQESCATYKECLGTYHFMKNSLDWIGTTEELDTITFPLLIHLVNQNNKDNDFKNQQQQQHQLLANRLKYHEEKKGMIHIKHLSEETIQTIIQKSAGDVDIYTSIQRDYNIFQHFDNYKPLISLSSSSSSVIIS